ncbi:MAG: DNA internalization-related competence protein ComEC/Rec2 [Zetaproteobacteria bacterium]|nr:MAG: DNA internalization-related competence protein ComEC/Rec2 [Zetaproteobacteria bacterium]
MGAVALMPSLPVPFWLAVAVTLGVIGWRRRSSAPLFAALAVGIMLHAQAGLDRLAHPDRRWLVPGVALQGTVAAVESNGVRQRLLLRDLRAAGGLRLDGALWCYLYGRRRIPDLLPGDRILGCFRLHRPYNHHNPGGFDFVRYARLHGVVLLGVPVGRLAVVHAPTLLARLRHAVRTRLSAAVASKPARAVLSALLLADRAQIDDATWQRFSATGTAHLLAISGLHVGMVAGLGFALVWWLVTRREAWIVALPVRRLALLGGVFAAVAYAALAGWTLPTRRAVLMLVAVALAWWLRHRASPLNTLLAALVVILLFDPLAIFSLSLWLSFVSVAALILWGMKRAGRSDGVAHAGGLRGRLRDALAVSCVASLATLPLVVSSFGRLPLYAPLANLLLVPLYGLWVLPMALTGAVAALLGWTPVADGLLQLAAVGVDGGSLLLDAICRLPAASRWVAPLPWWGMGLLVLGLAAAALLWWRARRVAALLLLAALLAGVACRPEADVPTPEWVVWDVGQGAATTLRLPGGAVLAVDAPGRRGGRFNGGVVVARGLRAEGVTHIDDLVVSHLQSDHAGGIGALLRRVNRVGRLLLADVPANRRAAWPGRWRALLRRRGGVIRWVARGDSWLLAGHRVRVLWPPRGLRAANPNNLSLVLSVALGGGVRMLLPGDAERPAERALLRAGIGRHRVMLVPHHGSHTSSSPALLRRLRPELAIVQSGRDNRFHFPDPVVVARYRALGAQVVDSADGALIGSVTPAGLLRWRQWRRPR